MKRVLYIVMTLALVLADYAGASAQVYRRENRRGNRAFAEGNYDKAVAHYETALRKDTVNAIPLLYNMAYVNHRDRRDSTQNMAKDSIALNYLDRMKEKVAGTEYEYDYHFNRGSMAIDMKDWPAAVDEFKQCMIMNPNDMKARENYIYAKKHLPENQGSSGGGGGSGDGQNDQNKDQQNDQNKDQQNDQNGQQNDQQGDDKQDQGDQNQGKNGDEPQDEKQGEGQPKESKISPQAAKQILQAMQAKERETQEKVEKKKAEMMKSMQKEKNW